MKKLYFLLCILLLILIAGIYKFDFTHDDIYDTYGKNIDAHDGTYTIAGQKIFLKNGISEIEAAPGSASKIVTKYFGDDIVHDINDDGKDDTIFLITQDMGGSGVFYYVVALVSTTDGMVGTEGILLGDRIAPQNMMIDENNNRKNVIVVNYAERKKGEDFTVAPSVGKSIWIKLDIGTMQWGEVAQNFEGESRGIPAKK